VQTIQNTVNTSTRNTKTPTHTDLRTSSVYFPVQR